MARTNGPDSSRMPARGWSIAKTAGFPPRSVLLSLPLRRPTTRRGGPSVEGSARAGSATGWPTARCTPCAAGGRCFSQCGSSVPTSPASPPCHLTGGATEGPPSFRGRRPDDHSERRSGRRRPADQPPDRTFPYPGTDLSRVLYERTPPEDLDRRLTAEAARRAVSMDDLTAELLAAGLSNKDPLEELIGSVHSGRGDLGRRHREIRTVITAGLSARDL